MTVAELIERLKSLNPHAEVLIEDEYQDRYDVAGVVLELDSGHVVIAIDYESDW